VRRTEERSLAHPRPRRRTRLPLDLCAPTPCRSTRVGLLPSPLSKASPRPKSSKFRTSFSSLKMSTPPPKMSHVAATVICNSIAAIAYTLVSKATLRTISLPLTALFVQAIVSAAVLVSVSRMFESTAIMVFRPWKVSSRRVLKARLRQTRADETCCRSGKPFYHSV
jgi:hypothetical protein